MNRDGRGVQRDDVMAHKWLSIAALFGSERARETRHELVRGMTTEQLSAAKEEAEIWVKNFEARQQREQQ